MKKEYEIPEFSFVKLQFQTILTGSVEDGSSYVPTDPGTWDDDDGDPVI